MELVKIISGEVQTTSRIIATGFNKEHKSVLRAIENLECSEDFTRHNFAPCNYIDPQGVTRTEYNLSRDGFSFLVMGFTGKEAANFKEAFIKAFNAMESKLKPTMQEMTLMVIDNLRQENEDYRMKLVQANSTIIEQAPIVQYANEVLSAPDLISTTIIAKELHMSATTLNRMLYKRGIQYKQCETWVLYSKYQDMALTHTKTHTHYDTAGIKRTTIHTYWTQKGRQFIHDLFNTNIKTA